MTEVIMPKMGDAMEEGTLVDWLKKDGEQVKLGEIIGHIQTDKATLELESPADGILSGLLIKEGETVPVGQAIGAVLESGEKLPSSWGKNSIKSEESTNKPEEKEQEKIEHVISNGSKSDESLRIKASPLAKKVAQEKGINLESIKGTGPGGRIVEDDVLKAEKEEATVSVMSKQLSRGTQRMPIPRLRQIIAQRTTQSKQQIPHFYVTVDVDVEKIIFLRTMLEEENSGKVSINDFVVKACALALVEMPAVNSSLEENEIVIHGDINVGIAAAVDDGLVVPVINNADQLTLRQLAAASRDLVGKAREGKLHPDEMSGSTFSISNLGMYHVDEFSAIIYQPNVAMLAIGSAKKVPMVNENDELEIRSQMKITGSFDHRVLDGVLGAKFMNIVKNYLENPTRLIS